MGFPSVEIIHQVQPRAPGVQGVFTLAYFIVTGSLLCLGSSQAALGRPGDLKLTMCLLSHYSEYAL